MQQYRVNYVLLIGLFVGGLLCSGAVYGLWLYQMKRHSGLLLDAALTAGKEGNYREAAQYFSTYVSFQPQDIKAKVKLANAYADLTEQDDVSFEEIGRALKLLEDTVRKMPEEKELQQRLVELYAKVGRLSDALDHLGYMLDKYPDDPELLILRAQDE